MSLLSVSILYEINVHVHVCHMYRCIYMYMYVHVYEVFAIWEELVRYACGSIYMYM